MCGICGQFNFNRRSADKDLVRKMAYLIRHRGPDDEGFYFEGNLGLGHRRLNIIDLKTGHQPMSNEDQTVWIVANNEIYNFIELREELQAKGHSFRTNSDTEVIIHLYEELQERCVEKLIGMFAFAIWDRRKKRLFLARDRFGIKPLHYFYDKNCFLFASEIKALLEYRNIDKTLNPLAIDQYFRLLYIVEPNTIFKKIHKLAPAHYLICNGKDVYVKKYWDADFLTSRKFNEEYYIENLRNRLNQSIKLTLRSDVPVGVFLSGGVDSSSVAGLAGKFNTKVKTFSVIFKEKMFSEEKFSRLMADKFSFDHHELIITADDAFKAIPKVASMLDEPFADSSCIPTYYVSKLARNHVKTVLTGEGGDELFAGYPWHTDRIAGKKNLNFLLNSPKRAIFNDSMLKQLYSHNFMQQAGFKSTKNTNIDINKLRKLNNLNKLLYVDLKVYLPSDMLVKMDRMSMFNSLEARLPLLNHDFAEFVLAIPSNLKISKGIRKYILKKSLRNLLPASIINREKMGFSIPMDIWLWRKGKFSDMIYDVLFDQRTKKRGYFDFAAVKKMFYEHDHLICLHGHRIWALFMFELWHRNFLDKN